MPDYIFHANITHFKKLLTEENDPHKIEMLQKLLAEEEAKFADWHATRPAQKAGE